jgi:hypothetical protein
MKVYVNGFSWAHITSRLLAFESMGEKNAMDFLKKQYDRLGLDSAPIGKEPLEKSLLRIPVNVCDGGADYYGAIYDIQDQRWQSFETNGTY